MVKRLEARYGSTVGYWEDYGWCFEAKEVLRKMESKMSLRIRKREQTFLEECMLEKFGTPRTYQKQKGQREATGHLPDELMGSVYPDFWSYEYQDS